MRSSGHNSFFSTLLSVPHEVQGKVMSGLRNTVSGWIGNLRRRAPGDGTATLAGSPTFSTEWKYKVPFATAAVAAGRSDAAATSQIADCLMISVLDHVVAFLSVEDIHLLACISSSVMRALADDSLWSGLVVSRWGIAGPEALATFGVSCSRSLFVLLNAFSPLQGLYTTLEDYPSGTAVLVRFDESGQLVADDLIEQEGTSGRLFQIRFSEPAESDYIKVVSHVFHHHRPSSQAGLIIGKQAEVRHVPRPGLDIPACGVFAQSNNCCSQLVLGPQKGVLEVVFETSQPAEDACQGTWFCEPRDTERDVVQEELVGELPCAKGEPNARLSEVLSRGTFRRMHNCNETASAVITLWQVPAFFVSDENRATMRAAGMVHWEVLPLPGLYIGDYGEQYGHRRKEVLLFEYIRGPKADATGSPIFGGLDQLVDEESQECWWLVGTKCCGDEHVHMGCCSFRMCIDTPPLMLQTVTKGVDMGVPASGLDLAHFRGQGMLALRGFYDAGFSPMTLTSRSNGDVAVSWSMSTRDSASQDAVVFRPRRLVEGQYLGKEWGESLRTVHRNDPVELRRRALLNSTPSDHSPVLAFQTGLISGEEDDNNFDD